ncbi:NACHT domain-containing protein [Nocardia sp. NPDC003693]
MTVETALARAAAPAVGAGVRGVYRRIRPDVSLPALRAHAEELAEGVRRRERSRLDHLGVTAGEEIPRTLRITAPHGDLSGADRITDLGGHLAESSARRLLILGDPGSGKTVAAAHLVLQLLARRPDDADRPAPVPVRVDASSWDPEHESLTWFLVRRLVADHRLHGRVAAELLAADLILPVLDGLDEIPAAPTPSAAPKSAGFFATDTDAPGLGPAAAESSGAARTTREARTAEGPSAVNAAAGVGASDAEGTQGGAAADGMDAADAVDGADGAEGADAVGGADGVKGAARVDRADGADAEGGAGALDTASGAGRLDYPMRDRGGPARALERINEPHWRGRPLVVLCRRAEYRACGGSVFAMPVAELRELRVVEIEAQLRRCCVLTNGDPAQWDPVFEQLAEWPRGVLAGALGAPGRLTPAVHLLRVGGRAAAEQLAGCVDADAVDALLFASLIDTAVAGEPPTRRAGKPRYSSAQVHAWLRTLARHGAPGHAAGTIALGEIWRMAGARCRVLHAIVFAMLGVLVLQGYSLLTGPLLRVILGGEGYAATTMFLRAQEPWSIGAWWGFAAVGGVIAAVRPWSAVPRYRTVLPARWAEIGLAAGLVGATVSLGLLAVIPSANTEGSSGFELPFVLTLVLGSVLACRQAVARRAPGSSAAQSISAQVAAAGLVFGAFVLCERLLSILRVVDVNELRALLWAPLQGARIWCPTAFLCAALSLLVVALGKWAPGHRPDELRLRRSGIRYWTPFLAVGLWLVATVPTHTDPGALAVLEVGWFLLVAWVVTGGGPWTAALLRYGCARLIFARGSEFTAHPAAFLAWCRRTGLLRVTGTTFTFRQDSFRRWLLDVPPPSDRG